MISGVIEEDKIQDLIGLGIHAFMRKPFKTDEFIGKVAELLRL